MSNLATGDGQARLSPATLQCPANHGHIRSGELAFADPNWRSGELAFADPKWRSGELAFADPNWRSGELAFADPDRRSAIQ